MQYDDTKCYKVVKSGCWEWQLKSRGGSTESYGKATRNGKTRLAHRYMYEKYLGKIPKGMVLHHKCYNRICVNPEHLQVTTPDMNNKLRKFRCWSCCKAVRPKRRSLNY